MDTKSTSTKDLVPSVRLYELDCLRGLAALMVFFFHVTTRFDQLYEHQVAPLFSSLHGDSGVYLFFIISGFVIFLTLGHTKTPRDFVISRFSRLYPAYWVSVAITFLALSIWPLAGRNFTLTSMLVNLSMLQEWLHVKHLDGVYWTLTVELSFYGVMLALFATGLLKKVNTVVWVWLLLIGINLFLNQGLDVRLGTNLERLLILEYGNLFLAGIGFYQLYSSPVKSIAWRVLACLVVSLGLEFFLRPDSFTYVLGYFIVFYAFTRGGLRWIVNKPLVLMGTLSYSFYLIHQNISYIIIKALYQLGFATPVSIIFIPFLITVCLAALVCFGVEKPALNYIRSVWKHKTASDLKPEVG